MDGGGGDSVTQTSTSTPWAGVQPYLKDYLKQGQNLYNSPFRFNAGDQIAGFSPEQQYGMSAITQRAINGSPVSAAASKNAYGTLNGDYMNPDSNPWLKGTVNQAMNDVTGRINSQFNNNNFGSSAHQELLSRTLGETAGNIYNQNYQDERGRQMSAMGLAPSMANSDYNDANQLMNVGAQRQGLSQQYLNQSNNTYQNYLNYPQSQLDNYGNVIRTGMGVGSSTSTTGPNPNQSNGLANLIGTGLSIYGAFGGF